MNMASILRRFPLLAVRGELKNFKPRMNRLIEIK
jgi:hypothetical protein